MGENKRACRYSLRHCFERVCSEFCFTSNSGKPGYKKSLIRWLALVNQMSTIVKKLPTKYIKAFSLADGQSYSAKQRFSKVTKINDLRRDMVVQKESSLGDLDKKKFFGIAQFQNGSFESEETHGVARLTLK